jgi:hypothetical protein
VGVQQSNQVTMAPPFPSVTTRASYWLVAAVLIGTPFDCHRSRPAALTERA